MKYILSDDQHSVLEALLPRNTNRKKAGRPPILPDRVALEGMLYALSTGCQWRKLPEEYGKWHTVYTRYVRWVSSGVFGRMLLMLQKIRNVDIRLVFLDSTTVRAHPCASGARKKRGPKHLGDPNEDGQPKSTLSQ